MARAARCGDARRIFCCHLGDGRGGTVGFPRKRNSARFTASNRHFSPVFLCFFTLAPADGLGARFAARSHRITRAAPHLSARTSLAVITPLLVCQTQNKIISKRFTRFASFFFVLFLRPLACIMHCAKALIAVLTIKTAVSHETQTQKLQNIVRVLKYRAIRATFSWCTARFLSRFSFAVATV